MRKSEMEDRIIALEHRQTDLKIKRDRNIRVLEARIKALEDVILDLEFKPEEDVLSKVKAKKQTIIDLIAEPQAFVKPIIKFPWKKR